MGTDSESKNSPQITITCIAECIYMFRILTTVVNTSGGLRFHEIDTIGWDRGY